MRWVLAFGGALFLGLYCGVSGAVIGFFGGLVLAAILSSGKGNKSASKKSSPPPLTSNFRNYTTSVTARASGDPGAPTQHNDRRSVKLIWLEPGQPVALEGIRIDDGMFYTSTGQLPWPGEPSAIDTSLKVGRRAADPLLDLGYYASYDRISPEQRRTYLEWLASGRTDSDPALRTLGYVFLFFYGLERRIIVEGDHDVALMDEIIRLLEHYGPVHRSRSLRSYALQLLHHAGWQLGTEEYRLRWPQLLQFDGERPDENGLRFVLANLFQRQEPLDWTVAYRLALTDEQSRRSTVVSRVREQFWALFEERYRNQFPEGIALQAGKQNTVVQYRPASGALLSLAYQNTKANLFQVQLPNVYGLRRQFSAMPSIWNSCVDDLSGYSRVVTTRKQGLPASVAAWQALPAELRRETDHPLHPVLSELLANSPTEGGVALVMVGTLASLFGVPERTKLSAAQSRTLVDMLSSAGWDIAPNPSLSGIPLAWTQEIALFANGSSPSPQLAGTVKLLFLAITLAAADGVIEDEEIDAFNELITPQIQTEHDWQHIRAMQVALRRDANVALRSLPQISKLIPAASREFVLKAMIHIAAADGEVSLDENKILRRIARAFGLDGDAVEKILNEDESFREVTVATAEPSRTKGEPIPKRPSSPAAFQLNHDRIVALTQETREVISLLSSVMTEEQQEVSQPVHGTSPPEEPTPEWLEGIDARYRSAVLVLIQHDALTNEDFEAIASTNHLLADALFDAVNSWSDENFGDFLLERSENIRVFRELLPETTAAAIAA